MSARRRPIDVISCEAGAVEIEPAFDRIILIGAVVALDDSSALLLACYIEGEGNLTWSLLANFFGYFLALTLGSW